MTDRHKQIINDAAANLFWTLAQDIGVVPAQDSVLATKGQCLFAQNGWRALLISYGYDQLDPPLQERFRWAVGLEAVEFAEREENLIGMVYIEDIEQGRSPSAMSVDCRAVNKSPCFIRGIQRLEQTGTLCLRSPLPAVVFADHSPLQPIISVSNTQIALGFQIPLFLSIFGHQSIGEGLFLMTGVFHIPVPDVKTGQRWTSIIPNASHFIKELHFSSNIGTISLEITW